MIADEIFAQYDAERAHVLLLIAQSVTLPALSSTFRLVAESGRTAPYPLIVSEGFTSPFRTVSPHSEPVRRKIRR